MDYQTNGKYFETNRQLWEKRTHVHIGSEFYETEAIVAGKSSLTEIEESLLPDLNGKRLLHLQCHFGLDTISLARRGAICTGIDFSKEAISSARELSKKAGVSIDFREANVYDTLSLNLGKFDVVFTSYGVLCWLPDLEEWAGIVADSLSPGGMLYLAEFHPALYMFDFNTGSMSYPYFNTGNPFEDLEENTYADGSASIAMPSFFWSHSISEVLNPLLKQGMEISRFEEYPFSPFNCFPAMKEVGEGRFYFGPEGAQLPQVFVVVARKK